MLWWSFVLTKNSFDDEVEFASQVVACIGGAHNIVPAGVFTFSLKFPKVRVDVKRDFPRASPA